MAKERKSSFRGKVGSDARKSVRPSRGYLNLPDGVKEFKIEENSRKIQMDILPYEVTDTKHPNHDADLDIALPGSLWYKRPFRVHRNVGAENESCVCPKSVGKPCPICDYQKKRFGEGADKEETKELYPKDRNLYVVVPIEQKNYEEVPHVWDMSQALFQDTLKEELEMDEENEVFPDLEEGKTLELSLKWKTLGNNTFPEVRSIKFLDRDPYKESVLDDVPNLDEVLKILSYNELYTKFHDVEEGIEKEEEEEEEVMERPNREISHRAQRTRKADVEEEEEEEEVDVSTKEEPPSTRRISRRAPAKEEEEEEVIDDNVDDGRDTGTVTRSQSRRGVATKKESDKCPYKHKFGIDTDKYNECNTCEVWDACVDELENSKK